MKAEDHAPDGRWVGRPLRRKEDLRHLTGTATFVDDIRPRGLLHAAFLRSPHAAAEIGAIDTAEAAAMDGVHAVLTADDLTDLEPWVPRLDRPEFVPVELPLLARGVVRHVGEPVALVVADSPHIAEDACERIRVEYAERDAVASIEAALADDAPRVHGDQDSNVLLDVPFADDPEMDDLLDGAACLVEATISSARLTAAPMEGRACLAEWEREAERLLLYTSTQVPHIVRTAVAGLLGLHEHRLRVVAPDVGGGFGQKCVVAREEVLLCVAARTVGRPVKWVEDRQENLVAGFQGHEQRFHVRAAFDADARLLGVDADILCDTGAYSCHPFTCGVEPLMAATELVGPYRVERYRARTRAVCTNKAPMAPYRGVSRPQMVLVMERLMQKAGRELGLEAAEVRRRNLVGPGQFPWVSPTGLSIDEGSYLESLDRCAGELGLEAFRERQAAAREEGRLLGIGFTVFAERTGYGTQAFAQRKMTVTPGFDTVLVRMDPSGAVTLTTGTHGHGQGHLTTLAQVAADELGMHPRDVEVRQGDTDVTAYGWGTFASRSMVVGGGAAKRAAAKLAGRLRAVAAAMLDVEPEDVVLAEGRAAVRGDDERSFGFDAIARLAYLETHKLPEGQEPGLECSATFDPPGTFSNACHGAIVELDPETGAARIERYLVVEDCGVMINPMIVEGQVRGGVAQGIAAALYERLPFTPEGQPQATSFMDYLVPTAHEIPPIEILHLETPSALSETGAKGMGEGGTMGATACVACAINDALAHLGADLDRLPIQPEDVRRAVEQAPAIARSAT